MIALLPSCTKDEDLKPANVPLNEEVDARAKTKDIWISFENRTGAQILSPMIGDRPLANIPAGFRTLFTKVGGVKVKGSVPVLEFKGVVLGMKTLDDSALVDGTATPLAPGYYRVIIGLREAPVTSTAPGYYFHLELIKIA